MKHPQRKEPGCATPIGYDWAVVWRNGKPIAAFATTEMAAGWIVEAPHRKDDVISTWPKKKMLREYWAEAQRKSRFNRRKS